METRNLGYASTNDRNGSNPLKLLGVPASSIPFYSPGDFCETSLRLHSIRKLLSHPRDKASQFQRQPSLLPLPFGASVAAFLLYAGNPSLTRYITEPQNIDPGNCWFVAEVLRLLRGMTSRSRKHSYPGFQKSIATRNRHRRDRTWEIRSSVCFAGGFNETDSIGQLGQPG